MNNRQKYEKQSDELYRAILAMKTPEECYNFFIDLCTMSELSAMEQRFEVAKLLREGLVYTDILEKTGVSSTTVSRVNRALNYGTGAYKMAFERLENGK